MAIRCCSDHSKSNLIERFISLSLSTECNAAVFSFIVNPLAPIQDTTCKLLNETYSEKLMRVPSEMSQFGGTKDMVTKTSQIGGSKGGGGGGES